MTAGKIDNPSSDSGQKFRKNKCIAPAKVSIRLFKLRIKNLIDLSLKNIFFYYLAERFTLFTET